MEIRTETQYVASLSEAQSFITSIAFPMPRFGGGVESDRGLYTLTASEDDHLRLYNLEKPNAAATRHHHQQQNSNQKSLSFLIGDYHLPATGCDRATYMHGNNHCLMTPRLRRDRQIYCLDLERGSFTASYQCTTSINYHDVHDSPASPWFGSLVVHPKSPGIFATQGEDAPVNIFHAGVSAPIARLSQPSRGRATIAFSADGNLMAVGDQDSVSVFDWRKLGGSAAAAGNGAAAPTSTVPSSASMILRLNVQDTVYAPRWVKDVGAVTGLDFFPIENDSRQRHNHLLLTTSRHVVRTFDVAAAGNKSSPLDDNSDAQPSSSPPSLMSPADHRPVQCFGASGPAASALPNSRPMALQQKRFMPTAARFSPDGKMVAVGGSTGNVCLFWTEDEEADKALLKQKQEQRKQHQDGGGDENQQQQQEQGQEEEDELILDYPIEGRHARELTQLHAHRETCVSNTEWCPTVPLLMSSCRIGKVWRISETEDSRAFSLDSL